MTAIRASQSLYFSLVICLDRAWRDYRNLIEETRKKSSARRVHDLRVASRRLGAALEFAGLFAPAEEIEVLRKEVRKVRRALGSMRDIQVELEFLKNHPRWRRKDFFRFEKKCKRKIQRKMSSKLNSLSVKDQRRSFAEVVCHLGRAMTRSTRRPEALSKLKQQFKIEMNQLQKAKSVISLEKPESLHQLRIAAKRLRYEGEILRRGLGVSGIDLSSLKMLQSTAGKIQDDNVFQKQILRFLAEKEGSRPEDLKGLFNWLGKDEKRNMVKVKQILGGQKWPI